MHLGSCNTNRILEYAMVHHSRSTFRFRNPGRIVLLKDGVSGPSHPEGPKTLLLWNLAPEDSSYHGFDFGGLQFHNTCKVPREP